MLYDALDMERRQRAPRRTGRRTTLTVPEPLLAEAEKLAAEIGTTTNDALIRLAEEAAALRSEQARVAAIASARRAAVDAGSSADLSGGFLSAEEVRAAVLSLREKS
jgi:predicted DNA-binding ribbon-helix-helix protein